MSHSLELMIVFSLIGIASLFLARRYLWPARKPEGSSPCAAAACNCGAAKPKPRRR